MCDICKAKLNNSSTKYALNMRFAPKDQEWQELYRLLAKVYLHSCINNTSNNVALSILVSHLVVKLYYCLPIIKQFRVS